MFGIEEFGFVDYVMIDFIEERLLVVYMEFKLFYTSGSFRFFDDARRCLFYEPRIGLSCVVFWAMLL